MYAIIADGGKQYKVEEGQELAIDYRGLEKGESVTFDRVLAVGEGEKVTLGAPVVDGASVTAEVVATTQGKKVDVMKLRRRKNSRRKTGHRSLLTKIKISGIKG